MANGSIENAAGTLNVAFADSDTLTGSLSAVATLNGDVYRPDAVYIKDYEKLNNKPSVNSTVLIGNRSLHDLGVDTMIHEEVGTLSNTDIESIIGGFN